MALDILVPDLEMKPDENTPKEEKLLAFILKHVTAWEDYRNRNFEDAWKDYYQQWKGVWTSSGKTRDSERSKFISPALAQAIEMAVSEMEEATFGRKYWFDVDDNLEDQDKTDRQLIRDQLLEDMEMCKVSKAVSECYLNSAIYGTGIAKIVVSEEKGSYTSPEDEELTLDRVKVELEPISPEDFAIDPSARSVDEGLGCAHIVKKAKADIKAKQAAGVYKEGELGDYQDTTDVSAKGESRPPVDHNSVKITEYHGLVPAMYLTDDDLVLDLDEDTDMIEAIVTIANDSLVLKAVANPFVYRDRSIVAFQYDTVPNRFWGRGVGEKGIQSQRALNAELRARQDGLALTIHPMMAIDSTRLPRGFRPSVAPGKTLLANGDPSTVYRPMHFGEMSAHTYREAGELERMLQMGTGSMDSATPIGVNARNATASGMSMMASGSIKRSKRTMRNVEEDFLKPVINKFSWRYQQFNPERYPFGDYKLLPFSTMGMIAREFEQAQISQVIQGIPDGPAKGVLLKSFVQNLTLASEAELEMALEQQFAPQPPDPIQQEIALLQLEAARLDVAKKAKDIGKTDAEIDKIYADIQNDARQTDINAYNAIDQTQTDELDRQAFGKGE